MFGTKTSERIYGAITKPDLARWLQMLLPFGGNIKIDLLNI